MQSKRDGAHEVPRDGAVVGRSGAYSTAQRQHRVWRGLASRTTSAEAQKVLGTSEPGASPVLTGFFHESPAKVAIDSSHGPAVEGEFALRLGRDIPASNSSYSVEEVADAVDAVAGAIEVVGSRFSGGLAGKGRLLTTADFGANISLVVGPWTADRRGLDSPHMLSN